VAPSYVANVAGATHVHHWPARHFFPPNSHRGKANWGRTEPRRRALKLTGPPTLFICTAAPWSSLAAKLSVAPFSGTGAGAPGKSTAVAISELHTPPINDRTSMLSKEFFLAALQCRPWPSVASGNGTPRIRHESYDPHSHHPPTNRVQEKLVDPVLYCTLWRNRSDMIHFMLSPCLKRSPRSPLSLRCPRTG
jgi:hypothetical protein